MFTETYHKCSTLNCFAMPSLGFTPWWVVPPAPCVRLRSLRRALQRVELVMQPDVGWLDGGGALWSGADERAWHVDVGEFREAVACLGLCAGYSETVAETVE